MTDQSNFLELAPHDIYAIGDNQASIKDVSDYISAVLTSPVNLASDNNIKYLAVFHSLKDGLSLLEDASLLPVTAYRDLVSYSSIIASLLAETTSISPSVIAKTLEKIVAGWNTINFAVYTSKIAELKRHIAEANPPYLKAFTRINALNRSYAGALAGEPPHNPHEDPAHQTIFAALAVVIDPLATIPDTMEGRITLRGAIPGLSNTISLAELNTSFVALIKSDETRAQATKIALEEYAAAINGVNSQIVRIGIKAQSVVSHMQHVVSAITSIPLGIRRFAQAVPPANPIDPTTARQQVIQEWAVVAELASRYITFVSTPGFGGAQREYSALSRPGLNSTNSRPSLHTHSLKKSGIEISPAAFMEAFGPPSYVKANLPVMATTTRQAVALFDKFLKLPYTQSLKVTNKQGAEISIREAVTNIKRRYEDLQIDSIPIVRDIYTAASFEKNFIPLINKDTQDGLALEKYVKVFETLFAQYGRSAQVISKKTTALQNEFTELLDVLGSNLVEIMHKMTDLQTELAQAEKEYDEVKTSALIEGLLGVAFTISAVVALSYGEGDLAHGFAIDAGTNFMDKIKDAIKAGQLVGIIANLKSIIESCDSTKESLKIMIPVMTKMTSLMDSITKIWEDTSANLEGIKENVEFWQNPEWYTPAMVEQAVNSWIAVGESSREYCRVVGNFAPETPETLKHNFFLTNTKYVAAAKAMFAEKPQSFGAATMIPHPAELIVGDDEKAAMNTPEAAVLFTSRNRVSEMLRAPDYKPFSIRRSQLTRTAGELETLSSGFRNIGLSQLASNCHNVSENISRNVLPHIDAAVSTLREFASRQPELPTLPCDEKTWEEFCSSRLAQISRGNSKALVSDSELRVLQNTMADLVNLAMKKKNELEASRKYWKKELDDAESEYNKYSWLWYIPSFLTIAIKLLLDEVLQARNNLAEANRNLDEINYLLRRLQPLVEDIQGLFTISAGISVAWANMTTATNTAANLWEILESIPEAEIDLARTTWKALDDTLARWDY